MNGSPGHLFSENNINPACSQGVDPVCNFSSKNIEKWMWSTSCSKNGCSEIGHRNVNEPRLCSQWVVWCIAGLFGAILGGLPGSSLSAQTEDKLTIGWIEKVLILPDNIVVHAKIDTGADNSSLHVKNSTEFLRGEEPWIRFTFDTRDGELYTLERPIHRYTHVKRKGAQTQKRAVVLLDLCLGTMVKKGLEVNLTDRSGFAYKMLIGRSFLRGAALVDAERTYTQDIACLIE